MCKKYNHQPTTHPTHPRNAHAFGTLKHLWPPDLLLATVAAAGRHPSMVHPRATWIVTCWWRWPPKAPRNSTTNRWKLKAWKNASRQIPSKKSRLWIVDDTRIAGIHLSLLRLFFLMSIMQMFNPSVSVSAHTFGSITPKETEYKGFCVTFFMRISVPFDSHDFCFKKSFMEWLSQCGWSMNIQNPFQKWHFAEPLRNTIMNFEWLFLTTCHRANFDEAFDPTKKHVPLECYFTKPKICFWHVIYAHVPLKLTY